MTGGAQGRPNGPIFRGRPVDLVVDVRSKLEYWIGHLDGAVCIPADGIGEEIPRVPGLNVDSQILLYCASGARSAAATATLRALGYRHVTDGGGMRAAAADYVAG
jgi:phage shock protein E